MFRRSTLPSLVMAIGTIVGCSKNSTPNGPSPVTPPADTFTVSIAARTPPGNIVFFPMFGSQVGIGSAPMTVFLDAQRSPAGTLSGGWSSTPASGVVALAQTGLSAQATAAAAGDATIVFRDDSGPSGTFALRSAPKFDPGVTIAGNTNTASADCIDTTPTGTTSICTDPADIGLGQRPYSFNLTSTASGTPPVVTVSGSFTDGGLIPFTISNVATISADGTFAPSGQINGNYVRPGVFAPPRIPIPVTVREDWTITAATRDSFTGSVTVLITPSGNRCGPSQTLPCTGTVTIKRTILTAQRR